MVAVLYPTGPGSQIVIDRAVVLVGRSADCDAVIDFSSRISRMHCVLVQVDADYYVRDLGSMNGVWVNGDRDRKMQSKLIQGDRGGHRRCEFSVSCQRPATAANGSPQLTTEERECRCWWMSPIEPILDVEIIEDSEFIDDVQMLSMR